MPPLENTFSWSISRDRAFKECRRRYYYIYYGSWMGWDFQAPPEARLLYRLKQILALPMWSGKVVHRTLEIALKRIAQRQPMTLDAMQTLARKMLNEEWAESETRKWMRHPKKHVNLFDHYYQREVSAEDRALLRDRVFSSLQGWFDLGLAEELAAVESKDFLTVEELKSFEVNGVKVWAVMDCAFRRDGRVMIYDWKTGKAGEETEASDQLICYALFAMHEWKTPLEAIEVALAYLPERQIQRHAIDASQLIEFRERLYQSVGEMTGCLADAKQNIARECDFDKTTDAFTCRECQFQEVCQRVD